MENKEQQISEELKITLLNKLEEHNKNNKLKKPDSIIFQMILTRPRIGLESILFNLEILKLLSKKYKDLNFFFNVFVNVNVKLPNTKRSFMDYLSWYNFNLDKFENLTLNFEKLFFDHPGNAFYHTLAFIKHEVFFPYDTSYICTVSDDDFFNYNYLTSALDFIIENPHIDVVYPTSYLITDIYSNKNFLINTTFVGVGRFVKGTIIRDSFTKNILLFNPIINKKIDSNFHDALFKVKEKINIKYFQIISCLDVKTDSNITSIVEIEKKVNPISYNVFYGFLNTFHTNKDTVNLLIAKLKLLKFPLSYEQ